MLSVNISSAMKLSFAACVICISTMSSDLPSIPSVQAKEIPITLLSAQKKCSGLSVESLSPEERCSNGEDQSEKDYAAVIVQAGNLLSNSSNGRAFSADLTEMATTRAITSVQNWLGRSGTARISASTGYGAAPAGYDVSLLKPVFENQTHLFFGQASARRFDRRDQMNLGLGIREFFDKWMIGVSTFVDRDLSQGHIRLGTSLEYWRDNLKLSANTYHPVSGWRDTGRVEDYMSRPAAGWDIRLNGWLPHFPQLGLSLSYEQYYGREVALEEAGVRKRDPRRVAAGISYTPVPLISLKADRITGRGGVDGLRAGIELRYQPGVPLRNQVDPHSVSALRTLAGNRYEFVERNNSIVLAYRKKDLVHLSLPAALRGLPGETKLLNASVSTKYPLRRIEWHAPALLTAGGRITGKHPGDYAIVLPTYQFVQGASNEYVVTGVAEDVRGNRSAQAQTTLVVLPPALDAANSTFSPREATLPADGTSTLEMKLTLKDAAGRFISVPAHDITLLKKNNTYATFSGWIEKSPGIFYLTVKAGHQAEILNITPEVRGIRLNHATLRFGTEAIPDSALSSFTPRESTLPADGRSVLTMMLNLRDAAGKPVSVPSSDIHLLRSNGARASFSGWSEMSPGVYRTEVRAGVVKETLILTPEVRGVRVAPAIVRFEGGAVAEKSFVHLDRRDYRVGNIMHITVMLKDASGMPVSGALAQLIDANMSVDNATPASVGWSETGNGSYSVRYIAREAGDNLKVKIRLKGWTQEVTSDSYIITAQLPDPTQSEVRVPGNEIYTGDEFAVSVLLRDTRGQPVYDAAGMLSGAEIRVPNARTVSGQWHDDGNGTYSSVYIAQSAGSDLRAEVKLSGWQNGIYSATYSIKARQPSVMHSTLTLNGTRFSAGDDLIITLRLRDIHNKPVTGALPFCRGCVSVPDASLKPGTGWTETGDGVYIATYIPRLATYHGTRTIFFWGVVEENRNLSSLPYQVWPGYPSSLYSDIGTGRQRVFRVGKSIPVSMSLWDEYRNPITGEKTMEYFRTGVITVTAGNASLSGGKEWAQSGSASVDAEYIAQTPGDNLYFSVTMSGWTSRLMSNNYTITP